MDENEFRASFRLSTTVVKLDHGRAHDHDRGGCDHDRGGLVGDHDRGAFDHGRGSL